MTSVGMRHDEQVHFPSQLGDVAGKSKHQLERTTLRTSRLLDFCSQKELIAQTGHQPDAWPLVVLKELVDNALDACEEAGVAPEITVEVSDTGITVIDNGPGIPSETVKDVLDFTVRVSSREAYVAPDRGAQGNALKTIVAMPYVLDGDESVLDVIASGARHRIEFTVDPIRQKPVIRHEVAQSDRKKGTKICMKWPDSACSILTDAKDRFLLIADDYTWLNPHLRLVTNWFGDQRTVEATDPTWQKWTPSDPTSAHWYTPQHLERLIAGYVAYDQDNGHERTVRELVAEFRGLSGSAKRKKVLDMTGLHRAPLSKLVTETGINNETVIALLTAMKTNTKPVKPAALGIIGKDHLRRRFAAAGCEMESFQYRKITGTTDGVPWVVEAAFGCSEAAFGCSEAESRRLVTGVNWSPGIINPFRELGRSGPSLDTILSQQRVDRDEPVILVLHMACPRVEYLDRGKSSVVIGVENEAIIGAVKGVTKKWAKQRKAEERAASARLNRRNVMVRTHQVTIKDAAWDIMEKAYLKAGANGKLPALARQIMYAARPYIQRTADREIGKGFDQYFTQTLLPDYMTCHPSETANWNVVFDARGHFHEPHTKVNIPLGTIEVRNHLDQVAEHEVDKLNFGIWEKHYPTLGPEHRYGAILFIEKEGFMPLINAVKLAERYDLAIMSTKGVSVTASRLLVDRLCAESGIPLLVLHDFDKSGFSTVGTLQRTTRRYEFEHDISVIDLGLRIGDIEGLETEKVFFESPRSARRNLRKNGATEEEIEFLLDRRVELNAFASDDLVAWIEDKLEEHGVSKVIPEEDCLASSYRRAAEQAFVQKKIDDVIDEARELGKGADIPKNLRAKVEKRLREERATTWDSVVRDIAICNLEDGADAE